jgi:hypothetical protein
MDLKVAEMSANVYRVVPSGSFRVGIVDETAASRVWRVRQVGQLFYCYFYMDNVLCSYTCLKNSRM